MEEMTVAPILLPEPYRSWLKDRMWAHVTPRQVAACEPVWRVFAKVPAGERWGFWPNGSGTNGEPCWTRLPRIGL